MRKRVAGEKRPTNCKEGKEKARREVRRQRQPKTGRLCRSGEYQRPNDEPIENIRPWNRPVKEEFSVLEVDISTDTHAEAARGKDSGKHERYTPG